MHRLRIVAFVLVVGLVAPIVPGYSSSADQNDSALTHNSGKLLFRSRSIEAVNLKGQIWTMNADGTNTRRVTCNDRDDMAATWSPNGQWIIFYSQETLPNGLPIQNLYLIGA